MARNPYTHTEPIVQAICVYGHVSKGTWRVNPRLDGGFCVKNPNNNHMNNTFIQFINKNKPYIIIDIRAYPNWVLNQIDELFSSHKTPFASYYRADLSCPGRFNSPTTVYLNPVESDNKVHYKKMKYLSLLQ